MINQELMLFENTFKSFMQILADKNNMDLDDLVKASNNDPELRK